LNQLNGFSVNQSGNLFLEMSGKAKKVGKYELCETIGRGTFSKYFSSILT
jgi:hypothetical protein